MRIVLLGSARSIHCQKIANGLSARGHAVTVLSLPRHSAGREGYADGVALETLPRDSYFFQGKAVRDALRAARCDVCYAHYATGYGTLLRASGFHPSVLAVWGSDVYDVPQKSPLHRAIVKRNLRFPDALFSTSHAMARRAQTLVDRPYRVTPFGVDLTRFVPMPETGSPNTSVPQAQATRAASPDTSAPQTQATRAASPNTSAPQAQATRAASSNTAASQTTSAQTSAPQTLHIGFMKGLYPKYGPQDVLQAFMTLTQTPAVTEKYETLYLHLVGDGPQEAELKAWAADHGLSDVVTFHGRIPHESVPDMLRSLSLYVAPSTLDSESFGVSAVEAMACGVPVVVSDVDGFREVTDDGRVARMVPRQDPDALAAAMADAVLDREKTAALCAAALIRVRERYDWGQNLTNIENGLQDVADGIAEAAVAEGGDR
ncbi:MAG: glycosyltransferase [Peptoniphilaceae bacterium]|nr:glycosyltransferase [Peptoniphilaceae bacterium]